MLIHLISSRGFMTDADTMVGVEKMACKAPDLLFKEAADCIKPYSPKPSLAPIAGVWHVKGWKRGVCALVVATAIAMDPPLVDNMRATAPAVHATFCLIHATVEHFDSPMSAIWASRAATMSSTSTRRAPNAFNHLHQLRKLDVLSGEVADLTEWSRRMGVMKAFSIGPLEAAAAMNMARHVPKPFVAKMQRLVEVHGWRNGPLSHQVLAMDVLALGKGPILLCKRWQDDMRNTEYTLELLANRIELDWVNTPKSMRKTFTPQLIAQKQLICGTFVKLLDTLRGTLPDAVYTVEKPGLEEKFYQSYLDSDLEAAAARMSDPWDMSEVADVVAILKRMDATICQRERERHREVMMRAELASFEQLSTELAMDQDQGRRFMREKAAFQSNWERKVALYKTSRYNRGLHAAKEFMTKKFHILDIPSVSHIVREVGLARKSLEDDAATMGSARIMTIVFMDMNIDHSGTAMGALKPVSDMLHMTDTTCLVLMSPQTHANFKVSAKLKVERAWEDKLLNYGVSLEYEGSLHYTVSDQHAADRRRLESRVRVIVSNEYPDSPWLQCKAARGNLGEAPLVKVKDMKAPASRLKEPQVASWRPHPADRVCQRGTSALEHLLNCILGGVNFQPNDRVLLVQVGVGEYAEMAHAVLNKMVQGTLPLITFKGFYINMASDIPAGSACLGTYLPDGNLVVDSSQLPINQIFLKRLMEEWWERQPEAGPREMPTTDRGTLLPPTVRLCSWSGEKLIIPSMLRDKFPPSSDVADKWAALVDAHTAEFGSDQTTAPSVGVHRHGVGGPDFSVEPFPIVLDTVQLESTASPPPFKAVAVIKRDGQPEVSIDGDGNLWLSTGTLDTLALQPMELLGFGKGEFKTVAESEMTTWTSGLLFKVVTDVQPMAMVTRCGYETSKTLSNLASIVFDTEVHQGIPNVELQNHVLTPMPASAGETHFNRFLVNHKASDGWGYTPDPLPEHPNPVRNMRHTEIGALLVELGAALPSTSAGLVWEVQLDRLPPPSINVLKPKIWLLKQMNLVKGFHYKLA